MRSIMTRKTEQVSVKAPVNLHADAERRVRLTDDQLAILRHLGAAMTSHYGIAGEPWTEEQVLKAALDRGIEQLERRFLGTDTLDPNKRS